MAASSHPTSRTASSDLNPLPTFEVSDMRKGLSVTSGSQMRRDQRRSPMVSVEEAAALLGQSKSSLYRAMARGELPFPVITIGSRHRISRRAIERVIDGELPPTGA